MMDPYSDSYGDFGQDKFISSDVEMPPPPEENEPVPLGKVKCHKSSPSLNSSTRPMSHITVNNRPLSVAPGNSRRPLSSKPNSLYTVSDVKNIEPDLAEEGFGNKKGMSGVITPQNTHQSLLGYFEKLGGTVKNWKRRWFVLIKSSNTLSYYVNNNESTLKGTIPLRVASSVFIPPYNDLLPNRSKLGETLYYFAIKTPTRTWFSRTIDIAQRDLWVETLTALLKKQEETQAYFEFLKKGKTVWKKHFFTVNFSERRLYYSKDQSTTNTQGFVELVGASVFKIAGEKVQATAFEEAHYHYAEVTCYGTTTYFRFPSEVMRDNWIVQLKSQVG